MDDILVGIKWWSVIATVCLMQCTPPPFSYTISGSYMVDRFSGRDISNRTIAVCPVLGRQGPLSEKKMPYAALRETISKVRPDVQLLPLALERRATEPLFTEDTLRRLYAMLFDGNMLSLQTYETFWKSLGADYLLVFYLRQGMEIHSFNKISRKHAEIEAELWDSRVSEVVWRVTAQGTCIREDLSDRQFLLHGISSIVAALPAYMPAYDQQRW